MFNQMAIDSEAYELYRATLSPSPCSIQDSGDYYAQQGRKLRIAILTSGGDSQGMNAAIRSAVRMALFSGSIPYAVREGYEGLVQGGPMITEFNWNSVAQIMPLGGTIIGSARSAKFRTREGRLSATRNLLLLQIDSLIVIGGDGSLTGADLLRQEWPSLIQELEAKGEVPTGTLERHPAINIAGLIGSIDKDMLGTETTIGADSALHRIIEAVDAITISACSHQRAFIIEVMGRHCGWLALTAALASDADWLFIPEQPQDAEQWPEALSQTITRNRALGKRESIVLLSEGAIDKNGQPITAAMIQKTLAERLKLDVRTTVLGHVQRGGIPSAYDRILATLQGVHAVNVLINAAKHKQPGGVATIIGMQGSAICTLPLRECVALTRSIDDAVKRNALDEAFRLRDRDFHQDFEIYEALCASAKGATLLVPNAPRMAVVHVGPPCGGMNTATFAMARAAINRGFQPLALLGGWVSVPLDTEATEPCNCKSFGKGNLEMHCCSCAYKAATATLSWMDVDGWVGEGGSHLGTDRSLPGGRLRNIARLFERERVQALMIIGGYEAYLSLRQLQAAGETCDVLRRIPIVVVPATISNNVPGTDITLGSDTALNMIVTSCDAIRQSASSQKRTFVVEVHGGRCGYLSLLGGLAAAATFSYLPEEGIMVEDILREAAHLRRRFQDDRRLGRLIVLPERLSPALTGESLAALLEMESEGEFDVRVSKLGHLQQGREPSPFDRLLAIRFAWLAVEHLTSIAMEIQKTSREVANLTMARETTTENQSFESHDAFGTRCSLIGLHRGAVRLSSISTLSAIADDHHRRTKHPSWMKYRPIARLLAKYYVAPEALEAALDIPEGILPLSGSISNNKAQ